MWRGFDYCEHLWGGVWNGVQRHQPPGHVSCAARILAELVVAQEKKCGYRLYSNLNRQPAGLATRPALPARLKAVDSVLPRNADPAPPRASRQANLTSLSQGLGMRPSPAGRRPDNQRRATAALTLRSPCTGHAELSPGEAQSPGSAQQRDLGNLWTTYRRIGSLSRASSSSFLSWNCGEIMNSVPSVASGSSTVKPT